MPRRINTVVVFGDSLSDIGKKWTTFTGRFGRFANEMFVSPTGRFSDCRNWTDFMYEEAGGRSLVGSDAEESYERSQLHMTLSAASSVALKDKSFTYLNYAEGGACGDTPHDLLMMAVLNEFEDQVNDFENDFRANGQNLGNLLFIIWFGANDLYTANRPGHEMGQVASAVARTQRNRLQQMVSGVDRDPKFIFVNLARPLTAVRYTARLNTAVQAFLTAYRGGRLERGPSRPALGRHALRMLRTNAAAVNSALAGGWTGEELEVLVALVNELRDLEQGVLLYNVELARIARTNGDRVVELASCLTEDTLEALVSSSNRLLRGAATAAAPHFSAQDYRNRVPAANLTTIDQVHPTDRMYELIWQAIRREILAAGYTFGNLPGVADPGTLSELAGPSDATRANFNAVLQQVRARGNGAG